MVMEMVEAVITLRNLWQKPLVGKFHQMMGKLGLNKRPIIIVDFLQFLVVNVMNMVFLKISERVLVGGLLLYIIPILHIIIKLVPTQMDWIPT